MSLKMEEVKKLAHLARLNLSAQEMEQFASQLSNILKLIAKMDQLDTQHIEPMAHPLELSQRLRDDQVTETDLHQKYQKLAPQVEAGLYLVPKVIEEA